MENTTKYRYRFATEHMLWTFAVLILGISVAVLSAERIMLSFLVAAAIYVVASIVRIGLSEKAVYIADTYLSVPRTNRIAFPALIGGNKNIRVPYESVIDITTSSAYKQEYLHIYYDDESTTLVSSMFESKELFEQFKTQLYSRLSKLEVEGSTV